METRTLWDSFGPEPPLIGPEELQARVLVDDGRLIVIDKPGWLVCHPSKRGPWSSLAGACREHFGLEKLHLVSRLDRETSGLVVLARDHRTASQLQSALQSRLVSKEYLALLEGHLEASRWVSKALGPDESSAVAVKQAVLRDGGQKAVTRFIPLAHGQGITLARIILETGRKHQIRAHAQWMGHAVVGDKLYGPDETLYLEFAAHGWTARMDALLPLHRQALHCHRLQFQLDGQTQSFEAPLPADWHEWMLQRGLDPSIRLG